MEPHWKKLREEYADKIDWQYVMGGMVQDWNSYNDPMNAVTRPLQFGPIWMHASQVSQRPMDATVWHTDPPASSYPSCIAVASAMLQSPLAGELLLNALREAVMTREIAHFQMFEAALHSITPNFPPGVLQGDPRHSNTYFNMSNGTEVRGPWNDGASTQMGETWQYIQDPIMHVQETMGLMNQPIMGTERTDESAQMLSRKLAKERGGEIKTATPQGENQWSTYMETE